MNEEFTMDIVLLTFLIPIAPAVKFAKRFLNVQLTMANSPELINNAGE